MLVDVEVADLVGTITLNRPDSRNALSAEVTAALDAAIADLDARPDVGCMVLTGADPAFCAGFDLRSLSTELRSDQQNRQRSPLRHLGLVPEHETPIIGAINGAAVTGGLELALSCDFLIASERARFADTHVRVGVLPGGGMTIRLPQLIGIDRARRMTYTGDFIDASTALAWGLVVEVVPHDVLLGRTHEIAATIAAIPGDTIRNVRRLYDEIGGLTGREAWLSESRQSREWMERRFDQSRLATEREAIIARGRSQAGTGSRTVGAGGDGGMGTGSGVVGPPA